MEPQPAIILPVEEIQEEIEEQQEQATDTEELVRTLTLNLERQNEILKEVAVCKERLEALSSQMTTLSTLPQVESPVNQQMAADLIAVKSQLDRLNSLIVDLSKLNQKPPDSQVNRESKESDSQNQESPMDVIEVVEEKQVPTPRRRVIKL